MPLQEEGTCKWLVRRLTGLPKDLPCLAVQEEGRPPQVLRPRVKPLLKPKTDPVDAAIPVLVRLEVTCAPLVKAFSAMLSPRHMMLPIIAQGMALSRRNRHHLRTRPWRTDSRASCRGREAGLQPPDGVLSFPRGSRLPAGAQAVQLRGRRRCRGRLTGGRYGVQHKE